MKVRSLTLLAMLTAVALILGWLDSAINIGIPGLKLGLSNIVLLYALYALDIKSAVMLMGLKVCLSALFFGFSMFTFLVSLGGGVLALLAMVLIKKIPGIDILIVSIGGALSHIIGQISIILLLEMASVKFVLGYIPLLGILSPVMGFLTGISAKYTLKALKQK